MAQGFQPGEFHQSRIAAGLLVCCPVRQQHKPEISQATEQRFEVVFEQCGDPVIAAEQLTQ